MTDKFTNVLTASGSGDTNEMNQALLKLAGTVGASKKEADAGTALGMDMAAKIASGKFTEADLLQENDRLAQQEIDLVQKINADEPLSRTEGVALGLLALLPVLVGGLAQGKKGIAIGAQAGALGSVNLLNQLEKKEEKEGLRAAAQLKGVRRAQDKVFDLALEERKRKTGFEDFKQKERFKARNDPLPKSLTKLAELGEGLIDIRLKEIKLQREERGQKAARRAHQVGPDVFVPALSDEKDIEAVNAVAGEYKNLAINLSKMSAIIQKNAAATRVVGPDANRLQDLALDSQNIFGRIRAIQGKLNNKELEKIESIVENPSTVFTNLKSALAGTATQKDKVASSIDVVETGFRSLLSARGFVPAFSIGQRFTDNGVESEIVGYGVDLATGKLKPQLRPVQ